MIGLLATIEGFDRLFGLDLQLLADAAVELVAMLVLFIALSYLLFNPTRTLLKKRQEKIREEMESAARDQTDAKALKEQYTEKIANAEKNAEEILKESRKKALKKENEIVDNAKAEAANIINRANKETELEKSKIRDEIKQEMISMARLMAGKIAAASMDDKQQAELIENTLKEMGDKTWQS